MNRTSPNLSARSGHSSGPSSRNRSPVAGSNNTPRIHQQQQQHQTINPQSLRIKALQNVGQHSHTHSSQFSTPTHHQQQQQNQGGGGYPPLAVQRISPRVAAATGSTPNSARSSSMMTDLECYINDVMRDRMSSLTESRKRVEELADLQKRETEMFLSAMEQVLAQSNMAAGAQREMECDFEQQLDRERGEKGKMLEILQRFKQEGDRVTSDLKRALVDEREQHRQAAFKNENLMQRVRELQQTAKSQAAQISQMKEQLALKQQYGGDHNHQQQQQQQQQQQSSSSNGQQHVIQLVDLLKEHERVIDELERRNRNLEHDLRYQTSSRGRAQHAALSLSGGGADDVGNSIEIPESIQTTATPQQQLNQLINQFAASSTSMPQDTMTTLVRGLMHQLRNENRMRLRVEEQSTKLVSDQDEQIRKLEARLREYEIAAAGPGGVVVSPGRAGVVAAAQSNKGAPPPPFLAQSGSSAGASSRRQPGGVSTTAISSPSGGAPRLPTLSGTQSGSNTPPTENIVMPSSHNNTNSIKEPRRQPAIGLDDEDYDSDTPPAGNPPTQRVVPPEDREFLPDDNNNTKKESAAREASVATSSGKAPSVSVSEVNGRSLEDQLNEVTDSFNDAVDSWQKAAGNPDKEFEPAGVSGQ